MFRNSFTLFIVIRVILSYEFDVIFEQAEPMNVLVIRLVTVLLIDFSFMDLKSAFYSLFYLLFKFNSRYLIEEL